MQEAKITMPAFGMRHVQAIMMFFALGFSYAMRVNMSMAIVVMSDPETEDSFDWSMQTQSVILSSFFWGYVILQIPGGLLADKVGGSLLIMISTGCNSIITLILPTAATYGGWQAVCACRFIQGLAQGCLFPCTHNLIGKWAPEKDKARFNTFIYSGGQLGTAVQLIISGYLADYWGWPAIFYATGICGALWTIAYIFIGAPSPQASKIISEEERNYIQNSLGHVNGHKTFAVPWKIILTSLPFYSVILVHSAQDWGYWTLMTELPSYMNKILGVSITANGVLSATPYIVMYLLSFPFGLASDLILARGWLSTTATRKLCNSIGFIGPAIALVGLGFVPAGSVALAVGLLCIVMGLNAGHYAGYMMVFLDMAPNFAGTTIGISNTIANFISIFAPLAAGAIIQDEDDAGEWRKVFYLASFFYIVANTFYVFFGTSELQSWNEPKQQNEIENGSDSPAEKTEKVV